MQCINSSHKLLAKFVAESMMLSAVVNHKDPSGIRFSFRIFPSVRVLHMQLLECLKFGKFSPQFFSIL